MSDTTPVSTPALVAPVLVSSAQVWSATAQNVALAVCATVLFGLSKIGLELWLIVMGSIAGVDFAGRKLLPRSGAAALGATGVLSILLTKFPLVAAAITALSAFALFGCVDMPQVASALDAAKAGQVSVEKAHGQVSDVARDVRNIQLLLCVVAESEAIKTACAKAEPALDKADKVLESADHVIDTSHTVIDGAIQTYTDANELLK